METPDDTTMRQPAVLSTPTRVNVAFSAARYLAGKALTILGTIFVAVLVTMVIVDVPADVDGGLKMSPFQMQLEGQVDRVIEISAYNRLIPIDASGNPLQTEVDAIKKRLRSEAGLDLSYLPRYLLWTYKALTFSWGELDPESLSNLGVRDRPQPNIILRSLPNTLLLVGTAYLLVFLIGMPFSLYLARHYGGWLDRAMTVLSPISSVPSWVFAMLLITVFAVELHWLPVSGMFDFHRPTEPIPYVLVLLKHMALPVCALVLSLLFQLVYTWRTFFIIYSEEDYVDLARAKGLNARQLERRYILSPALPYIITSFATSLIGFWQLTIALERVFTWPGIGLLYLDVLPDFHQEHMQVGDLMVVVQIVVTFAYLLGMLAILLDLAYVIVDPRIHLIPATNAAQTNVQDKPHHAWRKSLFAWMKEIGSSLSKPIAGSRRKRSFALDPSMPGLREFGRDFRERINLFAEQLRLYPSALFGLTVIVLLIAGSLYTLIALPYEEIGLDYSRNRVTGRNLRPRIATPAWLNLFRTTPQLSRILIDEKNRDVAVTMERLENGWLQKTVSYEFDYSYKEMPSDVFLYLDSKYTDKIPFISFEWTTPDGRTIPLKAKAMGGEENYDLQAGVDSRRLLRDHLEWKRWFVTNGQYPTPVHTLLFAKPGSRDMVPQPGTYRLKIISLLFEETSDIQAQLVVLGQVYGLAGTDYWRRDLIVPLLWGMPFSLMVGLLGTLLTALIAILLPAIGVWFGGWLDTMIQRLTEMNMVLPGLAIASIVYALHGVHIWIILAVVVVLNALGAPIKTFRSAFLQAKEAPYIEMARSYGASNFRIITRYLVPRILPVMIPYLVMQIPTFIFLEATLGFFRIRSVYPSWGRIIFEGLAQGALYGSPFWVLEPIFLLLLTGLAFAMLGLALERILNPRVIADVPVAASRSKNHQKYTISSGRNRRLLAGAIAAVLVIAVLLPSSSGRTLASVFMSYFDPSRKPSPKNSGMAFTKTPLPTGTALLARMPITPTSTEISPAPTIVFSPTVRATATSTLAAPTSMPVPPDVRPVTYSLQRGEYPYCIARRFNVDPGELLALNGLLNHQTFYAGIVLQMPQSGDPYPGERMQKTHPAIYTVSESNETMYTIACQFGDVDPSAIAEANHLPVDSSLYVGQQLTIP